ncbi:MAG: aminotransferase class V-fold PLP-dependent enzyme [Caldilinea sp.]
MSTSTTTGSLPDTRYAAAQNDFQQRYPAYAATTHLDDLRADDYIRLDLLGHVYLDYTGGGLYARSQVRAHHELLAENVFGNPHSQNPSSLAMTHLVEQARAYVLRFFGASPSEYTVIFTPNASGALKLVGESYPFAPGGRYALLYDNHNSVNGIREFARMHGAAVTYVPVSLPDLRAPAEQVLAMLETADRHHNNLFAYPAQSNFSGVHHPLDWVEEAHARGWDVLLDCAAFTPTNRLDLSRVKPDFVPLSFYKIFGYPTGVGALIARNDALAKLHRPWFAGGTITITSVQGEGWHSLIPGSAGFEDGTVNYLNLPAVEIGLRHIERAGIDAIHERVMALTGWLLETMAGMRHSNGAPMVYIYGPAHAGARGGTIAFTLRDPSGEDFDFRRVEVAAAERNISLRTGCFCNPGDGEIAHGLEREEMACYFTGTPPSSFYEFYDLLHVTTGKTPSTIRVSLGLASNFADVYHFTNFLAEFLDRRAVELPWAPEPTLAAIRQRDSA